MFNGLKNKNIASQAYSDGADKSYFSFWASDMPQPYLGIPSCLLPVHRAIYSLLAALLPQTSCSVPTSAAAGDGLWRQNFYRQNFYKKSSVTTALYTLSHQALFLFIMFSMFFMFYYVLKHVFNVFIFTVYK